MEIQQDFRGLLALFNEHKVEHMIIGAYALAFHGAPRYTGYIDVLVEPETSNAQRIMVALDEFGFGSVGLEVEDFDVPDKVIQLGVPPVRVDIVTSITGVSWEEAFADRVEGKYGDIHVYYIGRKQLISNKRALGKKRILLI